MSYEVELDRIQNTLDAWMQRMDSKVDGLRSDVAALMAVRDRVEEHHARIYGNGQPGILKDVDRLKQWKKALYWIAGLMGTATAADLFSYFVEGRK
jgi:ribosome modulation factor